jgi:hypothetical protein
MEFALKLNLVRFLVFVAALLFGWGHGPAAWADGVTAVSIRNNPGYADLQIQLHALVNTFGFYTTNHFCVVGYETKDDADALPYIYWPTQNKLIVWGFGSNLILGADHYYDLTRDILPDGAMTMGYLHRSDVKKIISDCREHGDAYTIKKTTGGWVSITKFSQFSDVKAQLQYLVDHIALQKINSFCIIGQKDGAFLGAYVYWRTENQLIFWPPSPSDDNFILAYPDVQIDLKHGLRDEEDSEDDRNEMQRSYAEAILKACQKSGQNFIVTKSNGKNITNEW